MKRRASHALLACAAMSAAVLAGCAEKGDTGDKAAEDYPSKSISYVIPFDPGGESDVTARLQQKLLEKEFGQKVVVSNKEGGGGAVAWSELANQAKPDGHTIMGANLPHVVLQPLARKDAGYETDDLKWAYLFQETPGALIVPKDSPYKTLDDFVQAAKKKKMSIGGSATYSANHMGTLKLNQEAGVKSTYVPFSGTSAVTPALLGGDIDAAMGYNTSAIEMGEDKVRVLAFASEKRLKAFPDVPTFKEEGYDLASASAWRGVAVPPDTPDAVVNKIAKTFEKVNQDPKLQKKLNELGYLPMDMGPKEAKKFVDERKAPERALLEEYDLLNSEE